jgi:hypothetical protein
MGLFIKDCTKIILKMEKVSMYFPIKIFIWVIGKMIDSMEMAYISILTVINTKENFKKDSKKEEESIFIEVVLHMKDNGTMIKNAELGQIFMPINKSIQEVGSTVKSMVMVFINIKMVISMMVNG